MKKCVVAIALLLAACGDEVDTIEELQDPNTCIECHATYHTQWSGSMHAYASDDPVFVAMNKRGLREKPELGTFCLKCHAPMAVANGTYTDDNAGDFDPSTLIPGERGVTCYFCHNVKEVTDDHNNGLVLAMDQTMRGGAKKPVDSPAHHSKYDPLIHSDTNESEMCGSCHDIVLPNGVAIERTFQEWKGGLFANHDQGIHLTCGNCHMKPSTGPIADREGLDVISRDLGVHDHSFPAIDQALTPWPEMDAQAAGIADILNPAIGIVGVKPRNSNKAPGGVCVPGQFKDRPQDNTSVSVRIDSLNLGHSFPSGSAFDRRVWLETTAYRADDSVVFQSGVVPDGMDPEETNDQRLFGMWDRATKADGNPAHFFWEVDKIDSKSLLQGSITLDQNDPLYDHSVTGGYINIPNISEIDRVETKLRVRPLPFATLRELVSSGDLSPDIAAHLMTLEPKYAKSTWLRSTAGTGLANGTGCNPE